MTNRAWCFVVALTAMTIGFTEPVWAQEPARPNVVVVLSDDQGWGDLSLNGNPNLSTPNIDSLARDGAEVKHFYVCAVCSPTRAEFLTGRYHTRSGVYSTSAGGERINADETTIADYFQDAGYATAAYGKWHSGMQYPYHPNARGFDDFYGFCSGHWGDYFSPMLEHNGRIVQGNGFLVDDLIDHAIEFITAHQDEPFFVYLPLNTPHSPMQVPDRQWDKFKDKPLVKDPDPKNAKQQNDDFTRAALAMCENIDENIGRLLDQLKTMELDQNTIVLYFCDNGPNGARFNGGMRGRKGSTHEGGLRSPLVIRYPDKIPAGTKVETVSAAIDLLPTVADLAGIKSDWAKPLDGRSFAGTLRGDKTEAADRIVLSHWNGRVSARSQRYRMHSDGQLFDIENDPGEAIDLSKSQPKIAKTMMAEIDRFVADTQPRSRTARTDRPITLGSPLTRYHQLPARDAIGVGGIERSNKYPNCSFMKNWTSTDDAITWDVEVLGEGEFEVTMYYACDEGDQGATIQLSWADQRTVSKIESSNAVPLRGMENDRVPRTESYVKDWKTVSLGTIRLAPGRGKLRLRALDVPGKAVAEMRLLMFTRTDP